MLRLFVTGLLVVMASLFGGQVMAQDVFSSDVSTEKKPWTHLEFDNDPYDFQFAIISDRSGGARPGVFEDAIHKLNWLRPEFVMSVGDLIDGVGRGDSLQLDKQWEEHFERIKPLRMPFFHIPGNHDIKATSEFQVGYWNQLFGTPFYSFRYKDVLFLALFTNEGFQQISDEQVNYFEQVLAEHADARWTLLFMHHPLWMYPHESNFGRIEALLEGREYTVFAGHHHRYRHEKRQDSNYYVLATTGGGSRLLGNSFGQFDHITWVTMSDQGPVITNLRLDGILPHDVSNKETEILAQNLIESVYFDTDVFVDSKTSFTKGKALLTYTNNSKLPLRLNGRFFHNHNVQPTPATLDVLIPAESRHTITVDLEAVKPFNLNEYIQLELDASMRYEDADYSDLTLSGTKAIPLKVSEYDLMATREVDFIGSYQLSMRDPLPGTTIRYSVDGSTPSVNSPVYTLAAKVKESATVKAALFDENGWMSEVDELRATSVQPGPGIWRSYYEYDTRKGIWNHVPDFSKLEPTTTKATKSLALEDAGPRNEFFGVVYRGWIDLPESGTYTFSTVSDDGSILYINGEAVVNDAVKHKARESFGTIELQQGKHAYEVHYYQHRKAMVMDVYYETPSGSKHKVDISDLTYDQEKPVEKASFTHGVASGDPDQQSVVLWTRLVPGDSVDTFVQWQVATDSAFTHIISSGEGAARKDNDFCVKVIAEGLEAGTTYYYRFVYSETQSRVGRTRTLPAETDQVRLGVANCSKYTGGYYHAYEALSKMNDLDAIIHVGDYIYENGPSVPEGSYWAAYLATGRQHNPPRHCVSLKDYRTRYAQYRSDPALQALHAAHPMINIWDDHEIAMQPLKKTPDGLPQTRKQYEERKYNSIKAYHEWLPIRPEAFEPIYRSFQFGDVVNLMMLDTRVCCRTGEVTKTLESLQDTSRHIVGHAQLNWMFDEVLTSNAAWNVMGNQILVAEKGMGWERWQGFPADRDRLLQFIEDHRDENFLVTTGNAHNPHHYIVMNPSKTDTLIHEVLPGSISSGNNAEKARYDPDILAKEDRRLRNAENVLWFHQDSHGFLVIDATQDRARVDWYFVSTIREKEYEVFIPYSTVIESYNTKKAPR